MYGPKSAYDPMEVARRQQEVDLRRFQEQFIAMLKRPEVYQVVVDIVKKAQQQVPS